MTRYIKWLGLLGALTLMLLLTQCKNGKVGTDPITYTPENTPTVTDAVEEGKTMQFKGNIAGGGGLTAYFDRMEIDATEMLLNATIEGNGKLAFTVDDVVAGIYRLRIGQRNIILVLDGQEDVVEINANLSTVQNFDYVVNGSANSSEYIRIVKAFIENSSTDEMDFVNYMDTTQFPLVGLSIVTDVFHPKRFQFINLDADKIVEIHERANQKVIDKYGAVQIAQVHKDFIGQVKLTLSQQPIRVGATPPDISMASPNGTIYSLSSLKGQIVLIDFWASWCRPCRFNNPELVRVYKKYKSQGFTVFSVSLDRDKQSWEQAILKDGLEWEYHVSDLKYWQSAPAKMYGVTGIPYTILLNRDGKIAAINPRGPQLEQAVQKVL